MWKGLEGDHRCVGARIVTLRATLGYEQVGLRIHDELIMIIRYCSGVSTSLHDIRAKHCRGVTTSSLSLDILRDQVDISAAARRRRVVVLESEEELGNCEGRCQYCPCFREIGYLTAVPPVANQPATERIGLGASLAYCTRPLEASGVDEEAGAERAVAAITCVDADRLPSGILRLVLFHIHCLRKISEDQQTRQLEAEGGRHTKGNSVPKSKISWLSGALGMEVAVALRKLDSAIDLLELRAASSRPAPV